MVAFVAVEKTAITFDKLYSYAIPPVLIQNIKVGCRVIVPFGRSNKKMAGLVFSIDTQVDFSFTPKPIISMIDPVPIITKPFFNIINYLVENTFCTYYDAIKTVLPIGLSFKISEHFTVNPNAHLMDLSDFTNPEKTIIDMLVKASLDGQSSVDTVLDMYTGQGKKNIIDKLLQNNILFEDKKVTKKISDKTVKMIQINRDALEATSVYTSHQQRVITFLDQVSCAMKKEVMYFCGVSSSVLKTMLKRGFITEYDSVVSEVFPLPTEFDQNKVKLSDIVLSSEQKDAYYGILNLINSGNPNVALLHGITGSGKTQVFIKLIEQVINDGKQVILLVPEIALTPAMVSKFTSLFGENVAVTHSGLSINERYSQWKKIKNKSCNIVIGTRSAVFAPLDNIGLIIMDEEGEGSYKSENPPRYHARDIAKLRVFDSKATLLLASATPSLDSYHNALRGKYSFFTLNNRYSDSKLPEVNIIDMKDEEFGFQSLFSETVEFEIRENLTKNEQTILLLNRRGFNTYMSCMSCLKTINCPNCDVSLTYHKANDLLMCHYCGYSSPKLTKCPSCDSTAIKFMGQGTQKIEDELGKLFPQARVLRMDTDTIYSKHTYEQNFEDFKRGKYDIMIGTQMIAKGLDFPNVTLACVLDADKGLNSPDFSSGSRVFSLITQSIGRSGRSDKPGRAFIQTYNPDNDIIRYAALQDYKAFYDYEIEYRKLMLYPPFCDMIIVTITSSNENLTESAAYAFLDILKGKLLNAKNIPARILGPTKDTIYKVNNKYRMNITIKCKLNKPLRTLLKACLSSCQFNKSLNRVTITLNSVSD